MEINARGLSCPLPVLKTRDVLDNEPEELTVLVDSRVQVENITRLTKKRGYRIMEVNNEDGYFKLLIKKDAG